jgi:WD40 repeat protein
MAFLLPIDLNTGTQKDRIGICEVKTGKLLQRLNDVGQFRPSPDHLTFSPDGKYLASTDGDQTHIWDTFTRKKVRTLEGHRGAVHHLKFSSDSKYLATASTDRTVLIWPIE